MECFFTNTDVPDHHLPILFISLILPILFPTRKTNIRKTSLRYLAFASKCYTQAQTFRNRFIEMQARVPAYHVLPILIIMQIL